MSGIDRGEVIMIDPRHPIHGGRMGVFEFMMKDTAVFSTPEVEPKVFFMIRPDDTVNYRSTLASAQMTLDAMQQDYDEAKARAIALDAGQIPVEGST